MVVVFIEPAESLGVNHEHIDGLALGCEARERRTPDPDSFRARVDGRSHSEALRAVEQDSVEEVALACAVPPSHCYHAQWAPDVVQHLQCFLVHLEL